MHGRFAGRCYRRVTCDSAFSSCSSVGSSRRLSLSQSSALRLQATDGRARRTAAGGWALSSQPGRAPAPLSTVALARTSASPRSYQCVRPSDRCHKHAMAASKSDARASCRGVQEQSIPVAVEPCTRDGGNSGTADGKRSTWRGNLCETTCQCSAALKASGITAHLVQHQCK